MLFAIGSVAKIQGREKEEKVTNSFIAKDYP
jgi:hypothetical protein